MMGGQAPAAGRRNRTWRARPPTRPTGASSRRERCAPRSCRDSSLADRLHVQKPPPAQFIGRVEGAEQVLEALLELLHAHALRHEVDVEQGAPLPVPFSEQAPL